ncbi:MAG: cupin domain-containing protein [Hyphomicrobiaceae bacterium]
MTDWSQEAMERRLVRYADLIPCKNAFVDTRTPGSDQKENFTIIGPGVSENPNQHVHIPEPHGFNIGAARQPGGCLNSQHSHETAEVFVVHTGQWRFVFGHDRQDGYMDADPGDVVSVPTRMFRGFEKRDEGVGFLWVALGGDDPGKVTWAPDVFRQAEKYGLRLLKGGRLVDTTIGEQLPPDAELEQPPSPEQLAALATPPLNELTKCALRFSDLRANPASPIANEGVDECAIINVTETDDGFSAGPITGDWPHGFAMRALRMVSGASVPDHARAESEVIFVHQGTLEVTWAGGALVLGAGDTLTIPEGLVHGLRNAASGPLVAYVVRGSENPHGPTFAAQEAAE